MRADPGEAIRHLSIAAGGQPRAASPPDASGHTRPAEAGDGRLRLAVPADPLFVTAA